MTSRPKSTADRTLRWVPLLVLLALLALSVGIWRQQVGQKREALTRHTRDVGFQASRRLEIFVDSHIKMASIFASRWAGHENADFSRERFEEFATVLLEEVSGYRSVSLLDPSSRRKWSVAEDGNGTFPSKEYPEKLIRDAMEGDRTLILPPLEAGSDEAAFAAVLPLRRDGISMGAVLVKFHVQTLLDECFHRQIRSEFNFQVLDGDQVLFRYSPDGREWMSRHSALSHSRGFHIRNRSWTLEVVPRREQVQMAEGRSSLSVLLFGFALSLGLAVLAHLLVRRMVLLRKARDRAMAEIQKRERAQNELEASEDRYHSVFDSATDGLVIIDSDRIVEANPAASLMHGYSTGELAGMDVRDLISPDHLGSYDEFTRQIEAHGKARVDSLDRRRDGSTLDVQVHGTILGQEGRSRILAVITDLSERKKNEKRLAALSHKILAAQEDERSRLSRDLHDELGQMLTAIRLEMDWLQKSGPLDAEATAALERSTSLVEQSAQELRRICRGLRPPLLDDLGLEPAVRQLVQEFEQRTEASVELDVRLEDQGNRISRETALCTYRILQEALTNISRHSSAREVDISLMQDSASLLLSVFDDGTGFDVASLEGKGSGITGMRERAHLVGGELGIRSIEEQGSRIEFTVPAKQHDGVKTP